jgi:predicted DNA-binding mobile mystery protein A
MKKRGLNLIESKALSFLQNVPSEPEGSSLPYHDWIRIVRGYLRMTQAELAARAKIPQSHVVKIESGDGDIQISTLKKVFEALSCDFFICPKPHKPLTEILRGRARDVALKRLKQTTGTMALEGQAPEADLLRQLLEKKTDEILNDPREKLWVKSDE